MAAFQVAGVGFEVVGLLLAVYGLRVRYREFGPEDRGAFDPSIQSARHAARRVRQAAIARVRRLLRRPQHVVVAVGAAHLTLGGSLRARVRVGFGPLPTGRSNKPALTELDRRTRDLMERVSNVKDALEDETARIDAAVEKVRGEMRTEVERIDEQVRRLATGDAGLQYVGFTLIAIGLILQGIGAAVGG